MRGLPILIGTVLFTAGLFEFNTRAFAFTNEPDGFRELPWQMKKSQVGKLVLSESFGSYVEYTRDTDSLNFEGLVATKIIYGFTVGKLDIVRVEFIPAAENVYVQLKNLLISRHGPAEEIGEKDLFWRGEKTNIKLEMIRDGYEIIFSDNKEFSKRLTNIDAFNKKFQAHWDDLLKNNDAQTAATQLKLWLDQEGSEILESYSVSPQGEQISLKFKGGGIYMFTPSPGKSERSLDDLNILTVRQVADGLKTNPAQYKGKDILIKAVVVDGVQGLGCADYDMIADPEDADLYFRKYHPDLSDDDRAKVNKIPLIKTGPTLSMPKGVLAGDQPAVYRGHFYDNAMKSCQDGGQRLVITGREKDKE